jgi:DNA-directed RNA polymerase specialized sigma24 family protein
MATPPDESIATPADVEAEIQKLTEADYIRIRRVTGLQVRGTGFCPDELVIIVLQEPWLVAMGQRGRRWPPKVAFMAYLIMTVEGMCKDERLRLWRLAKRRAILDSEDESVPDVADLVDRHEQAKKTLDELFALCTLDRGVLEIIKAEAEGASPEDVQQRSGMTRTEYNTARRRLRRRMERLLADRVKETRHRVKEEPQPPPRLSLVPSRRK